MTAWIITLSRVPLAALVALLAAAGRAWFGLPAAWPAWLFWLLVASAIAEELTDLLDGRAARRMGTVSELGGLADPLCDSLGRLTIYFALALCGWLSIAVPLAMTARDIVCAYVRVVLARCSMRTSARFSGKLKAAVQAGGIFTVLALQRWGAGLLGGRATAALLAAAAAAVIAVTLWSGADYLRAALPAVRRMLAATPAPPAPPAPPASPASPAPPERTRP